MRRPLWMAGFLVALPTLLLAQNSAYAVLGVGFPNPPFSIVARSLGGGIATVDPQSSLNPGAVALINALSVQGASLQEFRRYTIGGTDVTGLSQTRFPYGGLAGRFGAKRVSYAVGFSEYAERTFDITTSDTITLRGVPVPVSDHSGSAGAVVDLRAALAWAASPRLGFGVAGHLLGGSAKRFTLRQFTDSTYRAFSDTVDEKFSGAGISAGVVATPVRGLRLGASARIDSRLTRKVSSRDVGSIGLPATLAAGFELRPDSAFRFAGSMTWRSWSHVAADVAASGVRAFDTWETGWGIELGGARGGPRLPIRLGFRYARLPFSPAADQPREMDLSLGTGVSLSGGRAKLDFNLERAIRDGGGASERAWQMALGFQIRP